MKYFKYSAIILTTLFVIALFLDLFIFSYESNPLGKAQKIKENISLIAINHTDGIRNFNQSINKDNIKDKKHQIIESIITPIQSFKIQSTNNQKVSVLNSYEIVQTNNTVSIKISLLPSFYTCEFIKNSQIKLQVEYLDNQDNKHLLDNCLIQNSQFSIVLFKQ
jgi:hypothetical protein